MLIAQAKRLIERIRWYGVLSSELDELQIFIYHFKIFRFHLFIYHVCTITYFDIFFSSLFQKIIAGESIKKTCEVLQSSEFQ